MKYARYEQLETVNLLLRKITKEDANDFFCRFGGNEQVARYMLWKSHKSLKDTQKSIEHTLKRYEEGNYYRWGIALRSDNSLIGMIDLLRFDEEENSCSFAYMIGESFWGKGFGTEALLAVLKYAFEKMDMKLIKADHMCENSVSGAIMRKVGMHYVKTYVAKYEKEGKHYDADEYEITDKEWKILKDNKFFML